MTIKISFGLRGENSPFITFLGISSIGQSSASTVVSVSGINAGTTGSELVNVENTFESGRSDTTVYELFNVHYSNFIDDNDEAFNDASEVADYINDKAELLAENVSLRFSRLNVGFSTISVSSGVAFTHSVTDPGLLSIFWNRDTFPSGVSVSPFDRRKITGTISSVGDYYLAYDKSNAVGITTSSLHIEVV